MASLTVHLLSVVLGVIFIFLGHIKLTPQFFPEYHSQVRNEFGKLNKEFPLYQLTNWRPYAKSYRVAVGVAEMSSGTLLVLGGGLEIFLQGKAQHFLIIFTFYLLVFSQSMANVILLVIIANFIIAFQKLNYSIEYLGTAIFLAFLLVLRLILASRSKPVKSAKKSVEQKTE